MDLKTDLKTYLGEKKALVEAFIIGYFEEPIAPGILHESMKYSLLAGGKRIRPVLCLTAYETCGGNGQDIMPQAAAIELIHTYSLIHDDLPAMDDDDLRRGKPTNHVIYGEAMAILAGDGLLTEAFRMFSNNDKVAPAMLLQAINELSAAAGLFGMVAGQAMDIISEGKAHDKKTLEFIHRNKTAALLKASVRLGGILYNADKAKMDSLTGYGEAIGLAFQIVDDILDVTGTTEELGKPQGSDENKNKMTYPAMYGVERSKAMAKEQIDRALQSVELFGPKALWFKEIANYLLKRSN
ncbi:polyprenyl synthetase family protein [Candidatus Magnetominusculus xianensis]|uniref:Polyprenyl synthetase n=1 Tax=Candidatus Magnetominusculus xianensis TaxID=1748249 RepID=A0ABR5SK05_9BACT|nr:farnesyl diphosphate synthase [Candidatus Magnetominusculus xianensis]KWT92863.1 polyprenyl synthetase [Candidatus Magnetominusculus xianensis]MBF0403452.1 polyprenyl synthetase family protein [Nitrospirota bacterium]